MPKSVIAKVDHLVDEKNICLGTDTVVTSISVDKNVASVVVVRNVTSTVAKQNVTSIVADNIIPITADKIASTIDEKQKFNASHGYGFYGCQKMRFLRKFYRFYELTLIYCFLYFDSLFSIFVRLKFNFLTFLTQQMILVVYNFTSTFHSYNYFDLNKLVMPNNRFGEHNLISNKFISNFFNVEEVNQFRDIIPNDLFDGNFLCYFDIYMDPKNLTSFQPFESNMILRKVCHLLKLNF